MIGPGCISIKISAKLIESGDKDTKVKGRMWEVGNDSQSKETFP